MATAMVSAFTGIPVRKDLAMTGEITLRGRVLPIGGLKSKILAAHLAGARMVVIPKKNEKDVRDIPEEIRKQIKIVLVETMGQVLETSLRRRPRPLPATPKAPARRGEGGEGEGERPLPKPSYPPEQPAVVVQRR
jgi:ATP-dependent Lon protease